MSRPRCSKDEWQRVFRRQRASGLSIAAFCAQEDIPPSSFFLWRRKLGDRSHHGRVCRRGRARFTEVKVVPDGAGTPSAATDGVAESSGLELRLGGGRRIVVRPGFDRRTLLELVEALEAGPDGMREVVVR